jgi:arylsulfatase A-like enzyme
MAKKIFLSLLVFVIVLGSGAWFNRIDLMLALVKYRSDNGIPIGPNREITWQQGEDLAAGSAPAQAPNIIFILADDLGINDISSFGGGVADGRVQTPNIDQLAAQGAVFQQSYAGAPICAASRAMIMTGRYPSRTGFEFTPIPDGMGASVAMIANSMDHGLPKANYNKAADEGGLSYDQKGLPASELTVAEVLKERGYHTMHIGKWHLGRGEGFTPNDQGFDESLFMASGLHLAEDDPNVVNAKLDFDPIDKFEWAQMQYAASFNNSGSDRFRPKGYLADYWTDESIKAIKANKNRPFFLYLAHWGVHTPLQATKEDYEAVGDIKPHRLRVYAAMVRSIDRSVGRIMQTLEEQGIADNTIVVFSSDNGGAGYLGLKDINAPYRGWKITMFEGGIRVPLFMKWPAKIQPGTTVDMPVNHIDIMPTLAAAAGAILPENIEIDGKNIMPWAIDGVPALTPKRTLFWQSGYYRVVRHGDWKLQVSELPKKDWLYNLAEDPTEKVNLAASRPEVLAELRGLLDTHRDQGRGPLYPFTLQAPVAVDKTINEYVEPGDEYIYWPN